MQRKRMRRVFLLLLGCVLGVALLDDPSMYDPQPSPDAPVFVDWRTGEWRQP